MAPASSSAPRAGVRGPVVLIGLMATGKTTIGRQLAERLGIELRDSDADIERDTGGLTVAGLVAEAGADVMHRREVEHLLAALAARHPVVVAAAASTVDDPRCVAALLEPCLLYTSPSPRDISGSRMPSSA